MREEDLQTAEAIDRMGDRGLYLEVARYFAQVMPATISELTAAFEAQNWPEMRRLAHSLKSNCAAIGAEDLRGIAYALERACHDGDGDGAKEHFTALCPQLEQLRLLLLALR